MPRADGRAGTEASGPGPACHFPFIPHQYYRPGISASLRSGITAPVFPFHSASVLPSRYFRFIAQQYYRSGDIEKCIKKGL